MKFDNKYNTDWVKKFAFFPVHVGGKTIWLGSYYQRYVEKKIDDCDCNCARFCFTEGFIERKLINNNLNSLFIEAKEIYNQHPSKDAKHFASNVIKYLKEMS